jgi:SAM-dependent methyltransferase
MISSDRPALSMLARQQLAHWPEHHNFMEASFAGRSESTLDVCETVSAAIMKLAQDMPGGIATLNSDYRFLCEEIVLPEEIHFRRFGSYRLSRFEDANAQIYSNADYMARYMNGLLMSNVFWANHANAFAHYATRYLPSLPAGSRHLEIGPGHGLLLYFAAQCETVGSIAGWDVSPTSIDKTRTALARLKARLQPDLTLQNLFLAAPLPADQRFDSLVMSEILEHLEDPVAALSSAGNALEAGGRLFVNVPANSPAPDHIFLFESLEHAADLVRQAGFDVIDACAFPMSGATLERARRHRLAVSCVVTARKPGVA